MLCAFKYKFFLHNNCQSSSWVKSSPTVWIFPALYSQSCLLVMTPFFFLLHSFRPGVRKTTRGGNVKNEVNSWSLMFCVQCNNLSKVLILTTTLCLWANREIISLWPTPILKYSFNNLCTQGILSRQSYALFDVISQGRFKFWNVNFIFDISTLLKKLHFDSFHLSSA